MTAGGDMARGESVEEWAARVAPTLDADDWKNGDALRRGGYLDQQDHERRGPYTSAQWSTLLAYRDKVAGELSEEQRGDMLHALGHPKALGWRNHYCAEMDSPAFTGWTEMSQAGLAVRFRDINRGRDIVFRVTDFGREVARELARLEGAR